MTLAYERARRRAPAVLLVHGLAADARTLDALAAALARRRARDRLRPPRLRRQRRARALRRHDGRGAGRGRRGACCGALGAGPAVVAGDGLRRARRARPAAAPPRPRARAAVLSDPPLFALVPEATEALAAERGALEEALRDGRARGRRSRPGSAAGAGRRRARPRPRRAPRLLRRLRRARDLAGHPRASCARSTRPAVVVTGPGTPAHVVAAADAPRRAAAARRAATTDGDLAAAGGRCSERRAAAPRQRRAPPDGRRLRAAVAPPSPTQLAWRGRIEAVLRLVGPGSTSSWPPATASRAWSTAATTIPCRPRCR